VGKPDAHTEGLKLLAGRDLSVEGVRSRLLDRGYGREEIEDAIVRLLEAGALDDGRVARAYARTAANIKGRGRLRVMRELHQMGIHRDVAAEALGEVFSELDERALITQAVNRKLRGRARLADANEYARLFQYLMRQGFSPDGVTAALRRFRTRAPADQE
jgi:regulatory protein